MHPVLAGRELKFLLFLSHGPLRLCRGDVPSCKHVDPLRRKLYVVCAVITPMQFLCNDNTCRPESVTLLTPKNVLTFSWRGFYCYGKTMHPTALLRTVHNKPRNDQHVPSQHPHARGRGRLTTPHDSSVFHQTALVFE